MQLRVMRIKLNLELRQELQDYLKLAEQSYASLHKDCEKSKQSWSQARAAANGD